MGFGPFACISRAEVLVNLPASANRGHTWPQFRFKARDTDSAWLQDGFTGYSVSYKGETTQFSATEVEHLVMDFGCCLIVHAASRGYSHVPDEAEAGHGGQAARTQQFVFRWEHAAELVSGMVWSKSG